MLHGTAKKEQAYCGPASMLKRLAEDTDVVLTMRRVVTKGTSEGKHEDDEAHYAIDEMEEAWGELNTTTEETKGEEDEPEMSRGSDEAATNQGRVVRVGEDGQKKGNNQVFEKEDWQCPCCGGRPQCLQGCKAQGNEKRRSAVGSESAKYPSQQKKKLKPLEALRSSEQDQQAQAGEYEGRALFRKIGCTADRDGAFSMYLFYVGTVGPWCGWWIADSVDSEYSWAHARIHTTYGPPNKGWKVQGVPSDLRVVEISDIDEIQVFQ